MKLQYVGMALVGSTLLLLACSVPAAEDCSASSAEPCEPEPLVCRDLPEQECAATSGCFVVNGGAFERGTQSLPEIRSQEPEYVGCTSQSGGGDYETCVVRAGDEETCYYLSSQRVPDGWSEDFGCKDCLAE